MEMDTNQPPRQAAQNSGLGQHQSNKPARHRNKLLKIIIGLIVILVIAGGAICAYAKIQGRSDINEKKSVNSSEFQALFLTNGQVYFGKLSDLNSKYVSITDIFYLQVQQTQSGQQNVQPASTTTNQSQVSLAKLGNELHGPEDKMFVSRDQVLFWENLKPDSKVSQAIDKYQNK